MLAFIRSESRFPIRVAAIIRRANTVLLRQSRGDSTWALPAGSVRAHESPHESIERELHHQLGLKVRVGSLSFVIRHTNELGVRSHQEIVYYYEVQVDTHCAFLSTSGPYSGLNESKNDLYEWFACESTVQPLQLRPSILSDMLSRPGASFEFRDYRETADLN